MKTINKSSAFFLIVGAIPLLLAQVGVSQETKNSKKNVLQKKSKPKLTFEEIVVTPDIAGAAEVNILIVPVQDIEIDIGTDINNDGEINELDNSIEEDGLGEIVWVDDNDDPQGEDDLQAVKVTLEPGSLSTGISWIIYDDKINVWQDVGKSQTIPSGSEMSPNWNFTDGENLPEIIYVEGVGATDQNQSTSIELIVKTECEEKSDKIVITVTDDLGHHAYFAGIRDYLVENQFKLFLDIVDAPGGNSQDFRLVAVSSTDVRFDVHDAWVQNPRHGTIRDVIADKPHSAIIINGTFFEVDISKIGVQRWTVGRVIGNLAALDISRDMDSADAPNFKGWFGQRLNDVWSYNAPNVEPPFPIAPFQVTDLRAAVGGLAALYPTYSGNSISTIIAEISRQHGDWNERPTNHLGLDTKQNIFFVMTSYDALADYNPNIVLHEVISNLVSSGADVIMGMDGGSSIALAHQNREGRNLNLITASHRHVGINPYKVNNYVIVTHK